MKKGWELKSLCDICTIEKTKKTTSDLPYVGLENIESNTGRFLGTRTPTEVKSSTFQFSNNHILYGRLRPYLNKVLMPEFEGHCSTEIFPINISSKLKKSFLYYWLTSPLIVEKINATCTGARMPRANMNEVMKFQLLIPEIKEQKQIVEILDTAFEALEKAKTNLEKNLTNTKELFASKLNDIFSQKGEAWEENILSTVCKTGSGGTPLKSKKEYYENATIPWLCSGEVKQGNIYNSTRLISKKGLDNSSAKLFPINTVVIAMYGATAGDVGILRFETSTNQAVCGILPNDNFLPEFIYYSFLYRKKELIAQATGNAQPNISQIKIKNTLIPIIDKEFQQKIINELEDLKNKTKQLEKKYQQKLDNLEELKKSLLQKAFSGELTK